MKQPSTIITSVKSRITVPQLALSNFYLNPAEDISKLKNRKKNNSFSSYFEEIDWSSATTKVDGFIDISFLKDENIEIENIELPVTTSFLFTCTKGIDEYYEVAWLISMS